jgi:hypothetical protein
VRPRNFEGNIDDFFAQVIEERDYEQVRVLLQDPNLSVAAIQRSFQNVIHPLSEDEEVANLIYFSNRLDQDFFVPTFLSTVNFIPRPSEFSGGFLLVFRLIPMSYNIVIR